MEVVTKPLIIMMEKDGGIECHIWPSADVNSPAAYGLIICDLVRHVAAQAAIAAVGAWFDAEPVDPLLAVVGDEGHLQSVTTRARLQHP